MSRDTNLLFFALRHKPEKRGIGVWPSVVGFVVIACALVWFGWEWIG